MEEIGQLVPAAQLKDIAIWAGELVDEEVERACRGIVIRSYAKGAYICHRGDRFDPWLGVVSGLVKLSTVSQSGKAITFAGIPPGGWFGEGSVLKNELRRYDLVCLRETKLAQMDRASFMWLYERSVGFNRYLVRQFNERLGQFIAQVEYERGLGATARVARALGWLFNPSLNPNAAGAIAITQEEVGLLSGLSRQAANKALAILEASRLIALEKDAIRALNWQGLFDYDA
jgi:CRP/FNR family transcriptional regulator, cyclic AMP receptor protein